MLLIGYYVNPGGSWSKDYRVLDLDRRGLDDAGPRDDAERRCGRKENHLKTHRHSPSLQFDAGKLVLAVG